MTWAYVNEEECNYDCAMPEDYIPASTDYIMEDHTYMDPTTEPMDGPMDASIEDINPNPENGV
jgi:hypothetical protein